MTSAMKVPYRTFLFVAACAVFSKLLATKTWCLVKYAQPTQTRLAFRAEPDMRSKMNGIELLNQTAWVAWATYGAVAMGVLF